MASKLREKLEGVLRDNPKVEALEVSRTEFAELLEFPEVCTGARRPSPPLKSRTITTTHRGGWFAGSKHVDVVTEHWDYTAPEYLRELAVWERESKKSRQAVFRGKPVVIVDPEGGND